MRRRARQCGAVSPGAKDGPRAVRTVGRHAAAWAGPHSPVVACAGASCRAGHPGRDNGPRRHPATVREMRASLPGGRTCTLAGLAGGNEFGVGDAAGLQVTRDGAGAGRHAVRDANETRRHPGGLPTRWPAGAGRSPALRPRGGVPAIKPIPRAIAVTPHGTRGARGPFRRTRHISTARAALRCGWPPRPRPPCRRTARSPTTSTPAAMTGP